MNFDDDFATSILLLVLYQEKKKQNSVKVKLVSSTRTGMQLSIWNFKLTLNELRIAVYFEKALGYLGKLCFKFYAPLGLFTHWVESFV